MENYPTEYRKSRGNKYEIAPHNQIPGCRTWILPMTRLLCSTISIIVIYSMSQHFHFSARWPSCVQVVVTVLTNICVHFQLFHFAVPYLYLTLNFSESRRLRISIHLWLKYVSVGVQPNWVQWSPPNCLVNSWVTRLYVWISRLKFEKAHLVTCGAVGPSL